jgi:hypothetical protein
MHLSYIAFLSTLAGVVVNAAPAAMNRREEKTYTISQLAPFQDQAKLPKLPQQVAEIALNMSSYAPGDTDPGSDQNKCHGSCGMSLHDYAARHDVSPSC